MDKFNLDDIDLYRVFSSMHEGVVISDAKGLVRYYNNAQAKIDDIDPKTALGKKVTGFYQLGDDASPTMRCLKSGKPIQNETLFYRTRLGKVANIIFSVYPLYKEGELIGAINFSKDYQFLEKIIVKDQRTGQKKEKGNQARFHFSDIIGSDLDLRNAIRIAMMSAGSPSPIMIYGETGTGKELFAQSIHNHSPRKKNPFIPVNCAAIPENLLEGILFGTSKGAFTGAINKKGLFELANGGTIFLDELDSMPLTLQAKLLRVVQEKKVRKLGSLKEISLDVKILSSVGQPPLKIIRQGVLRMDLFYRMGVVSIMLPPLMKRRKDFGELVAYFILKYNKTMGEHVKTISQRVSDLFLDYHWPGNVRELEHIVEASMNMVAGGKIIKICHLPNHIFSFVKKGRPDMPGDDCPEEYAKETSSSDLVGTQAVNEKQMIRNALQTTGGNAAKAARSLGVSPQSFHYKLKKYELNRKDYLSK